MATLQVSLSLFREGFPQKLNELVPAGGVLEVVLQVLHWTTMRAELVRQLCPEKVFEGFRRIVEGRCRGLEVLYVYIRMHQIIKCN